MVALYNEIDPYAAAWLRNLIDAGHIAPGVVDTRSIEEITPDELADYTQVHFFAGLGGWSHALRLAGWPDDRPVWTASCPCQPFSDAGKGAGFSDERHLWPSVYGLLAVRRPPVVFGEQVASKDGLAWLELVRADLEAAEYALGAADLCAAGVGAPHIRQRLFWVADADDARSQGHAGDGAASGLGDSNSRGRDGEQVFVQPRESRSPGAETAGAGGYRTPWSDPRWVLCDDPGGPRWRPVEPGSSPLVDGVSARVGRLRAYGNAIVPQVAAEVIGAYMEVA